MNRSELQQLKMAWIVAKEANDTRTQVTLLRDHPEAQADLIEFIAAYSATNIDAAQTEEQTSLLPLTQRASQAALERVFAPQPVVTNLQQLRAQRGLTMVSTARGLRLSVDVWKKIESGAIELVSLSEKQLTRLAQFFQVSIEQFSSMLNNSQPTFVLNRRQTQQAARSEQQSPKKQSFAEAIEKSTMNKADKGFWLEN
ncbi:MAG TPA: helix-turn-helix transcriptional regulator [Ktedonobacteraceae bacterium]|nr:helix-turn-helix transcriptional regulator [Ktedonobacteraceae bacterium]